MRASELLPSSLYFFFFAAQLTAMDTDVILTNNKYNSLTVSSVEQQEEAMFHRFPRIISLVFWTTIDASKLGRKRKKKGGGGVETSAVKRGEGYFWVSVPPSCAREPVGVGVAAGSR